MKLPLHSFTIGLFVLLSNRSIAQCSGGLTAFTLSFDTTATGNGNSSRTFAIPKFDPALGTLISIDIKSVVGLQYSYTLENQTFATRTYKTKIVRTDDIYSTAIDPASINAVNQTPPVSTIIAAYQQTSYGPSNMNYMLTNVINDGRMINFMGAGTVDFDYETGTSASVQGPLPWQLNFTSVTDTTHFSVTYNYCATNLLSTGLLFFSAVPQKDKILLNWRQSVVESQRVYHVQVSSDGSKYTTIASVNEDATGAYNFTYPGAVSGRLFFRLQEINVSGAVKYSNIRVIEAQQYAKPGVSVLPTIYTGGSLQVNLPYKSNWTITVFSAQGRSITQSLQTNGGTAQLVLPASLGNGLYTAAVTDTKASVKTITRIIIQR